MKDGGHTYFIRFLDSMEAYPEQRAMAAFVLAVIVDTHRRGQEACIEAGLIHVCLKHLQGPTPNDSQTEPLFLQWLCLCLGKLWEDFTEAQIFGLQADAPAICAPLLSEPQPEVYPFTILLVFTYYDYPMTTLGFCNRFCNSITRLFYFRLGLLLFLHWVPCLTWVQVHVEMALEEMKTMMKRLVLKLVLLEAY